jgi:hypothetical protein
MDIRRIQEQLAMKFQLILFFCVVFALSNVEAQNVYSSSSGEVSFFSETPLENIEAHNKSINSFINVPQKQIAFLIPIRKFDFEKDLMEEHFNEKYLESDRFPNASFRGTINEDLDFTKDGKYKVTATGKITIHGVEREETFAGEMVISKGEINLTCNFTVKLEDYKITIPKIVFNQIAEVIAVKMNIKYIPYKK